jgi:two-component system phosphate regulon sensor histidine kinase PhoR
VRNSLFWKLGLPLLLLLGALIFAADAFVAETLHRGAVRAAGQHIESVGRLLETHTLHSEDPAALAEWSRWSSHLDIRVTVFSPDLRVLADASGDARAVDGDGDTDVAQQAFSSKRADSVRRSIGRDREIYYRALGYSLPGVSPVVVRVAALVEDTGPILWWMRIRLWGAALLLLAAGAGVWLVFLHRFERRAEVLSNYARQLAAGDFRPLGPEPLGGELATLARALSDASASLDGMFRRLTSDRNFCAAVLAGMTEGVAVVGDGGRIAFANQAFREAVGAAEDCRGRPLIEVVRQHALLEAVQGAVARAELIHAEVEFGTVRPRIFAATAAPVAAEGARGAVLVLHDVSEIRRLERVRRDFVANVSHELRTPLTTIQGFAETLLGGALNDPAAARRFLGIIRTHAARLARLTDDLLKLSAIEGGMMTFQMQPVSVAQLIEHCLEAVSLKAQKRRLAISRDCAGDVPLVRGDSLRLEEVLKNLLENALQYTPSGGSIRVLARGEQARVLLCVEDTGIGVPSTDQERIFERFYRVDAARSREAGGTGLGLAIAKHIVEAHDGRIWVESELGKGSRFFVSLPAWQAELDAPPRAVAGAEPAPSEPSSQPA